VAAAKKIAISRPAADHIAAATPSHTKDLSVGRPRHGHRLLTVAAMTTPSAIAADGT
jgi:hypothetical protein